MSFPVSAEAEGQSGTPEVNPLPTWSRKKFGGEVGGLVTLSVAIVLARGPRRHSWEGGRVKISVKKDADLPAFQKAMFWEKGAFLHKPGTLESRILTGPYMMDVPSCEGTPDISNKKHAARLGREGSYG